MALVRMIIWWLWPHYGDIIGWLYDVTCWLWWWKWWRWLYLPSCVCIAPKAHQDRCLKIHFWTKHIWKYTFKEYAFKKYTFEKVHFWWLYLPSCVCIAPKAHRDPFLKIHFWAKHVWKLTFEEGISLRNTLSKNTGLKKYTSGDYICLVVYA